MSERDLHRELAVVFRQGLGLAKAEEDALWHRFTAERLHERQAWAAYRGAMLRLPELLGRSVAPSRSPSLWEILGVRMSPSGARINFLGLANLGT